MAREGVMTRSSPHFAPGIWEDAPLVPHLRPTSAPLRGEGVGRAQGRETLAGSPLWTFSAISRDYGGISGANECRV